MTTIRRLIGVTAILAVLTVATTPAAAQFSGSPGQVKAGMTTIELSGIDLTCVALNGKFEQQEPKVDDLISINWELCKTGSESATINCNGIQFESPEKEGTETGKATLKLLEECRVKTPSGCEVKLPTTGNQKLGKTALKKEATGVLSVVETTGITANVNKTCELGGLKSTENAKLKSPTLKQEGLALI
jgi:hypothetical protein